MTSGICIKTNFINMHKNIVILLNSLALAAALLSGCAKTSVPGSSPALSSRPILFSSLTVDVDVKADYDAVDGEFPSGATVGVLGYCLTQDESGGSTPWATKKTGCHPFMHDYDGTSLHGVMLIKGIDGGWSYSPLYSWYEDDSYLYSFFAYSPCDPDYFSISTIGYVSGTGIEQYNDAPEATFTLPFEDTGGILDRKLLRDAMLSNNIDLRSTEGAVSFQFYHMTAGLRFRVNNYNSDLPVTVTSLTLGGTFNKEMVIEAQTDYVISGRYSGTFTVADAPLSVAPNTYEKYFTEDDGISKVSLLLIPNIDDNRPIMGVPGLEAPRIVMTYRIGDGEVRSFSSILPDMNYRNGMMHDITFNFLGSSLTLSAEETEWDNEFVSDIVFE